MATISRYPIKQILRCCVFCEVLFIDFASKASSLSSLRLATQIGIPSTSHLSKRARGRRGRRLGGTRRPRDELEIVPTLFILEFDLSVPALLDRCNIRSLDDLTGCRSFSVDSRSRVKLDPSLNPSSRIFSDLSRFPPHSSSLQYYSENRQGIARLLRRETYSDRK